MALFKQRLTELEKQLIRGLAVGCQGLGLTPAEGADLAEKTVRAAISECKRAGSYNTAPMGDFMVQAREREDLPPVAKLGMQCLRRDCVSDDDLRRWWDRSQVERKAEEMLHNFVRGGVVMSQADTLGLEGAGNNLRKSMALFGDPWTPEKLPDEDKDLPWELRDRIMSWVVRNAQQDAIQAEAQQHSSYNAFLRSKIKDGII